MRGKDLGVPQGQATRRTVTETGPWSGSGLGMGTELRLPGDSIQRRLWTIRAHPRVWLRRELVRVPGWDPDAFWSQAESRAHRARMACTAPLPPHSAGPQLAGSVTPISR